MLTSQGCCPAASDLIDSIAAVPESDDCSVPDHSAQMNLPCSKLAYAEDIRATCILPPCFGSDCALLSCSEEAFTETDQRYLQADSGGNRDDGCTAVTAVIVGNTVVVAHVGDSRAVLAKTGKGERAITTDLLHLASLDENPMPLAKSGIVIHWFQTRQGSRIQQYIKNTGYPFTSSPALQP